MNTNNKNDFSKRTQSQVTSFLIKNGVAFKPENLGDGRTFYINDNSLKKVVDFNLYDFEEQSYDIGLNKVDLDDLLNHLNE